MGAALMTSAFSIPAIAQDSSYTPTTVWQVSSIKVLPGQFEAYLDYLGGNWRKQMEFGKKEGVVVSYHIFSVNDARDGEPDLMLAIEYADYLTVAKQLEYQKKFEAMLKVDAHTRETQSGQRAPMRTQAGSMELQELKFK
jgi:hypothetical protein